MSSQEGGGEEVAAGGVEVLLADGTTDADDLVEHQAVHLVDQGTASAARVGHVG